MKKVSKLACMALLGFAAAGMWAQDEADQKATKAAAAAEVAAPMAQTPADYVIGADDTLHISVWKEPDLTATLPVRPDGLTVDEESLEADEAGSLAPGNPASGP